MDYKLDRILRVSRYKKIREEKDTTSGVTLIRYLDTKGKKDFLVFKSREDAKKYYKNWISDEEALNYYVENSILESEIQDNIVEVIQYKTDKGDRFQSRSCDFDFGKSEFVTGLHYPVGNYKYYPVGYFSLNVPFKAEDRLTVGIGSSLNMGKAYSKDLTIDEFMKLMTAKGKFYTPYIFEGNKRLKKNATIKENSITVICIDVDNMEYLPDILKEKEGKEYSNTLLSRITYYLQQISKSGEGVHFFIPVRVKNKAQMDKILNYLQIEFKGLADISIFEPARLIFSSPYKIEEISKIALAREFYIDKELTQKEPVSELQDRIDSHQLTVQGRKNYVKNSGSLFIRTYVDGDKLVKWFEEKHGKITTKKLVKVHLGTDVQETSKFGGKKEISEDVKVISRVEGSFGDRKVTTRIFVKGIIPFIEELSKLAGFTFKRYESIDKNGKLKVYYQLSISPNEETPFDVFWYLDNPEFLYFQSYKALRHLNSLKYLVSYTSDGRPVLHISNIVKLLWNITKNFSPSFRKEKFRELIKKYEIHNKYIYSHFEEIEKFLCELVRELKNNGNKPVKVNKFLPKEVISKSKVFRSMRYELEKLGFVFKRTRKGLMCWYERKDEEEIREEGWKGLPPKLRKELREFFESINISWYEEIVEELLEKAWVSNLWWWVHKYVEQELERWENLFKRRLKESDYVYWIDKDKAISAKSFIITKLVA